MAVTVAEAEAVAAAVAEAVAVAVAVAVLSLSAQLTSSLSTQFASKLSQKLVFHARRAYKDKKHYMRALSRPKMTTLTMKITFLEISSGSSGSTGNGGSNSRSDPPPTRAGGQDDGS